MIVALEALLNQAETQKMKEQEEEERKHEAEKQRQKTKLEKKLKDFELRRKEHLETCVGNEGPPSKRSKLLEQAVTSPISLRSKSTPHLFPKCNTITNHTVLPETVGRTANDLGPITNAGNEPKQKFPSNQPQIHPMVNPSTGLNAQNQSVRFSMQSLRLPNKISRGPDLHKPAPITRSKSLPNVHWYDIHFILFNCKGKTIQRRILKLFLIAWKSFQAKKIQTNLPIQI